MQILVPDVKRNNKNGQMKKGIIREIFILIFGTLFLSTVMAQQQRRLPCSGEVYRQFDFWIGHWEAFGKNNQKAGDSKISVMLDSCVILEEWTGSGNQQGLRYAGKSFNSYNNTTRQWQQTWVDNTGGSNQYLSGKFENGHMVFLTGPFPFKPDSLAIRRLTFYNLEKNKVRQHGEISKDNGSSWNTEYDLEYRRVN
jgi:hypothetical protein